MALDNSGIATKIFRSLMLRDPSASELAYWKNELDLGLTTPAGMVYAGAGSAEFANITFKIANMYESVFGKYATNTELMAWRLLYDNGASLSDIGLLFVRSSTYTTANPTVKTTSDYVTAIAKSALGRSATNDELSIANTAIGQQKITLGDVVSYYAQQSLDGIKVGLAMLYAGLTGVQPTSALLPTTTDVKVAISTIIQKNLSASSLSFDSKQLLESTSNDGSITGAITINLLGGAKFVGSAGAKLGDVTKTPDGLIASLTKLNDTQAILKFTGKAKKHDAASAVSDLTVTFKDADFSGAKAADVEGSTTKDLSILFRDTIPFSEVAGLLSLSGTVLGDVVINLTSGVFTIAGSTQTLSSGSLSNVTLTDASGLSGGKVTYTGTVNADVYFASAQGDSIRGMAGNDVIQAGAGTDTFVFESSASANGCDVIDGFKIGTGGDVLNVKALLNSTGTSTITPLLATSTAAAAWSNGDVLVVSGSGLTSGTAIANLFGVGKVYAAPSAGNKAVVISADVIGNASVWHIINQLDVTNITVDEVSQIATLVGINNLSLVPFVAGNFA